MLSKYGMIMFIRENGHNRIFAGILPRALCLSLAFSSSLALAGCMPSSDAASSQIAAAMENGDFANAVAIADGVLSGGEAGKEILRLRGIAKMGAGDYSAAAADLLEALSLSNGMVDASDIDTSYYLAVAQYKTGDKNECETTLSAITDIKPKEDKAYLLRGKVRLSEGDKEAAKADFDKAISLAPTKYDYYVQIYEELLGAGYESEGNAYLEKALAVGSKLSDYYKGVLEYYMGAYTDARNDLENAGKSKDDENIVLYLGKTYEALGDSAYAVTLYEQFIQSGKESGKIYEELSYLKMNQKDYEGALGIIETGLNLGGSEGKRGMMFNRIVAYENLYDFSAAKEAAKEYLELYPDDQDALRENIFLSSR